jgi:hypothetical protein
MPRIRRRATQRGRERVSGIVDLKNARLVELRAASEAWRIGVE